VDLFLFTTAIMVYSPRQKTRYVTRKNDMNRAYWEEYYRKNPNPFNPSAFAKAMVDYLPRPGALVELGCGNGRDAVFLSKIEGVKVTAIDQCPIEIEKLNVRYKTDSLRFVAADFSCYHPVSKIDYVYSRWTMHAIKKDAEERTLKWVDEAMSPGGRIFIEARSIHDDLYGQGREVGEHAFITDHYRRFVDLEELQQKLVSREYQILEAVESRGFAKYLNDDPLIVRVVASKL
jgi:tellurite methyltransferase